MEKVLKECELCKGRCVVGRVFEPGKKYRVMCTNCGNESEIKTTRSAAINAHNKTSYRIHKTLF